MTGYPNYSLLPAGIPRRPCSLRRLARIELLGLVTLAGPQHLRALGFVGRATRAHHLGPLGLVEAALRRLCLLRRLVEPLALRRAGRREPAGLRRLAVPALRRLLAVTLLRLTETTGLRLAVTLRRLTVPAGRRGRRVAAATVGLGRLAERGLAGGARRAVGDQDDGGEDLVGERLRLLVPQRPQETDVARGAVGEVREIPEERVHRPDRLTGLLADELDAHDSLAK